MNVLKEIFCAYSSSDWIKYLIPATGSSDSPPSTVLTLDTWAQLILTLIGQVFKY